MSEKTFAEGIFFDRPREGSPEFVKGRISFKVDDAITFLQKHKNEKGYVNCDLLKSKDGKKLYFTLNTYKKKDSEEDIPF